MKIPIAYTDLGCFQRVTNNIYFFQHVQDWHYENGCQIGTWREFITRFPKTAFADGSRIRLRAK